MGHRDSSPEEPGGHFSMAAHADEHMEAMEDRATLQAMLGWYGPGAQRRALGYDITEKKCTPEEAAQYRKEAKERYTINKAAKVGEIIFCATCNNDFIKKQHQQAFCSRTKKNKKTTKCKDVFHNTQSDTRRARSHLYMDR